MKKTKSKTFKSYILHTLILLFSVIFSSFVIFQCFEKKKTKNVKFRFSMVSNSAENISCKIKLNDSIFIKSADISKTASSFIELKDGFYKIEVSTINGDFKKYKEFKIKNSEKKIIYITFFYFLNYNDYLPIYKKRYFERYLENKSYSKEEKSEIWRQVNEKITLKTLKLSGYTPQKRVFEIEVRDSEYMID
ncbi:hypothetical protein [Flavobacterium aquiphilum]|uniref:hypothetical protein n=1 Tax=Flavobacterium aquiphilum TaxID=3003261 RepID=UPI0024810F47|nr:hypothetical protein [Flavobacterium aquiphilum]